IERFISEIRSENYQMFRGLSSHQVSVSDLKPFLSEIEINSVRVDKQSPFVDKTLGEVDLRNRFGVTVLMIRRGAKVIPNPHREIQIRGNDIIVVLGTLDSINKIKSLSHL
ncbi:MAG: cation:proton antiporter regulatory subunit, partial [Calditrichia bacterium]